MEICEDKWLSNIFGHLVFKVDPGSSARLTEANQALIASLRHHSSRQTAAMYYAKVDTTEIDTVRCLNIAGMFVVEANLTFALEAKSVGNVPDMAWQNRYAIDSIRPDQRNPVLEIAGSCFRYSRFHLDPLVPSITANRIKQDWIFNYILGRRGEKLFVATVDDRPAGFIAVISSDWHGRSAKIIDLMGVDRAYHRKGVGRALVDFFILLYKDECDVLLVGTQAANIPSMCLYQKAGFSIARSTYVLHMHVKDGQVAGARRAVQSKDYNQPLLTG